MSTRRTHVGIGSDRQEAREQPSVQIPGKNVLTPRTLQFESADSTKGKSALRAAASALRSRKKVELSLPQAEAYQSNNTREQDKQREESRFIGSGMLEA